MKLATGLFATLLLVACSDAPANVGDDGGVAPADDAGNEAAVDPGDASPPTDAPAVNPACVSYPKGPYGVNLGDTLNPHLSWAGYAPQSSTVTSLTMSDLWDCDGSKGIDALMIDTSAGWCAACETQANDEGQLVAQYVALNIKPVTLVIMDAAENTATTDTALAWRTTYKLDGIGVYADPNFFLMPTNTNTVGLPLTLIIDPRTMKVVVVGQGYGSSYPLALDKNAVALAKKNHTSH